MNEQPQWIDGLLVQWGDRLFYPPNRVVRSLTPKLSVQSVHQRADEIRRHIGAVVLRRVPQVMVKVTGGGRGMKAIAAHFRYISKAGRLEIEDELGMKASGREAVRELTDAWRYGGSRIPEEGPRREALNVMLSMPQGTDPLAVLRAAREFAQIEFKDHRYVMVLHDHQANPHVHLSVRMESKHGHRLNPRKADLRRWRELFAERLKGWGVEAGASSRASRGAIRGYEPLWRIRARSEGRLLVAERRPKMEAKAAPAKARSNAWQAIIQVLESSEDSADVKLASAVRGYMKGCMKPTAVCELHIWRAMECDWERVSR
ncbi:conjugal transfer protein TraS [Paucibacter sp. O1-1]|uniref:relaxase/mobilization nuclease domain-containing protein n=1 Tax=Paucibacter sp. M5-1 TaxID=3015998 RepID=UPI0021D4C396|nr:conjugal transfer protein TraS [Paucibacter sp. M5-1]MCU7376144.1 conjugal transfer protein TraS [Paucibacter sp. O1-1]MCZ7885066.1 conjugal transfer protein TraS [Paucibacter sp. M5-1]MDA3831156.1 conjugal transfer protein TraS [Paucibacter sp. O1-1]